MAHPRPGADQYDRSDRGGVARHTTHASAQQAEHRYRQNAPGHEEKGLSRLFMPLKRGMRDDVLYAVLLCTVGTYASAVAAGAVRAIVTSYLVGAVMTWLVGAAFALVTMRHLGASMRMLSSGDIAQLGTNRRRSGIA